MPVEGDAGVLEYREKCVPNATGSFNRACTVVACASPIKPILFHNGRDRTHYVIPRIVGMVSNGWSRASVIRKHRERGMRFSYVTIHNEYFSENSGAIVGTYVKEKSESA